MIKNSVITRKKEISVEMESISMVTGSTSVEIGNTSVGMENISVVTGNISVVTRSDTAGARGIIAGKRGTGDVPVNGRVVALYPGISSFPGVFYLEMISSNSILKITVWPASGVASLKARS